MKRIKPIVFTLFVMMTALCLSACGNRNSTDETTGSSSSAAPATMETTMGTTMESSGSADENTTESTGVIDGMIHDVEKGVDDITGESNGRPTAAVDDSAAK